MPNHKETMEVYKSRLLQIMLDHVGSSKAISMAALYSQTFGEPWNDKINDTRRLRQLITGLRSAGVPVCSSASNNGGGYFIASAGSELTAYLGRLRSRALGILSREAKMRKQTLPELLGQLALDLDAA
jgi:hypothetical protein